MLGYLSKLGAFRLLRIPLPDFWNKPLHFKPRDLGAVKAGAGGDQWSGVSRWLAALATAQGSTEPRGGCVAVEEALRRGLEAVCTEVEAA